MQRMCREHCRNIENKIKYSPLPIIIKYKKNVTLIMPSLNTKNQPPVHQRQYENKYMHVNIICFSTCPA